MNLSMVLERKAGSSSGTSSLGHLMGGARVGVVAVHGRSQVREPEACGALRARWKQKDEGPTFQNTICFSRTSCSFQMLNHRDDVTGSD